MRTRLAVSLALAVLSIPVPRATAQLSPGNPLDGLEQLRSYETRRASSSDPNWRDGNWDARPIAPGETLTIAELQGPGVITHIWCTIAHDVPHYSSLLTLRMYWDGEEQPSVEAPIGDFFCIGHGEDRAFMSIPVRITSGGRARNCYWPMPFGTSARITVTNESSVPVGALYWYVDWQAHAELPPDTAYFHAMYRQEFPCVMGRNYLLADIEGRGHYVGTVQSVYHVSDGWYGEGDDFFFIDGAQEPSLSGTGSEDYFCDAWGFRQQDGPSYGTPLWEGFRAGDRGTAYRFHIADPVVFQRSLRVEIEHKGSQSFADGTFDGFIERDDLMSSVAFWYQEEPHKPWPAIPPGPDRLPFSDELLVAGYRVVEASTHSEHPIAVQELGGVTDGKQLFFTPADDKGWVEIPFTVAEAGTVQLIGKFVHSYDYGTYRALLDGRELQVMNLYQPEVTPSVHNFGSVELTAGDHVLRLECVGKSETSRGHFLGFDALVARTPVYTRPAGKDLRDLQAPAQ